jgi:type I restriction enzyme M protein
VIKLPSGVFLPYAGVSTAILVFTRTCVGGTRLCGSTMYALTVGRSMTNANRSCPMRSSGRYRLRCLPKRRPRRTTCPMWCGAELSAPAPSEQPRTAKSFCIPKDHIAAAGYDLSLKL